MLEVCIHHKHLRISKLRRIRKCGTVCGTGTKFILPPDQLYLLVFPRQLLQKISGAVGRIVVHKEEIA